MLEIVFIAKSTYTKSKQTMSNNKTIAFIGLGTMGVEMAKNLAQKDHNVVGWNRSPDRPSVREATAYFPVTSILSEAVRDADCIFTCVSDVKDVESVIFREGGIAKNAKPHALIVDFSTIGATAVREIAAKLKERQLRFLDAPISGGDIGAKNGTLTIMVGGDRGDFDECYPYFEAMGKNITYCGKVGSGQAVKLCNQVLCSVHMVALCEAMQLARYLDVDPALIVKVCSTGAAGSWALSNLGQKIVQSDFEPGFMVKHILKDLRLIQEGGDADIPGVKLADRLFKVVEAMGGSEQGTQAMIRAYRES